MANPRRFGKGRAPFAAGSRPQAGVPAPAALTAAWSASGLFGVLFGEWTHKEAALFIDTLKLFGIGASWGGFESLAILANPGHYREAAPWEEKGTLVRLHVGLEDPADLIADLEAGFAAVREARR